MLFIFGVGEREVPLATLLLDCEVCGNRAAHRLSKLVKKVSLFFIPLIPVGTRFVDMCSVCGRMREVSKQQAESAAASTQAHLR